MKLKTPIPLRGERGSSTASVLVFVSVLAVGTTAIVSNIRDNKKAAKQEGSLDSERRANEAALQTVSQLVNTGSLFFNSECNVLQPQVKGAAPLKNDKGVAPYSDSDSCNVKANFDLKCSEVSNGKIPRWRYSQVTESADVKCFADDGTPKESCEVVDVCVPVEGKRLASGKIETKLEKVRVVFESQSVESAGSGEAKRTERRLGVIKAQREGRNARGLFFSSLKATINFGAEKHKNRSLAAKHGASDVCFYMKPATVAEKVSGNVAFKARSRLGSYRLGELEPREDGPLDDEFQRPVYIKDFQDDSSKEKYAVLSGFQDKIIDKYKTAGKSRGARPTGPAYSESSGAVLKAYESRKAGVLTHHKYSGKERINPYFVGVMPKANPENPGGPEFEHFLSASKSKYKEWMPDKTKDMYEGCQKSGKYKFKGGDDPDFCTRVKIPFMEHKFALHRKCRKVELKIPSASHDTVEGANNPPPKTFFASRAVQVSCDPRWIDLVEKKIKEEREKLENINNPVEPEVVGKETTADMLVEALEVDDAFLESRGRWAKNPLGGGGQHPIRAAYDAFVAETMSGSSTVDSKLIKFVGDKDISNWVTNVYSSTDSEGNVTTYTVREISSITKGKEKTFSVYEIANADFVVELEKHKSETCAYFAYFKPTEPGQCYYEYTTNQEKSYVCRNNDGCFDESTRIRMADGTDRLVTQLSLGEYVYNPVTQKPSKIVKLTIGPEFKPLIHVTVGNNTVKVTDSHPFMTKRGWVQAKNLSTQDWVRSGQGHFEPVKFVRLGATGRTVANLALEGSADLADLHYVLADGVVTGDLVIQNMLSPKAVNEK